MKKQENQLFNSSIDAIEKINAIVESSKLKKETLDKAKPALEAFAKFQNFSLDEALIAAAMIEMFEDFGRVSMGNLSAFFGCPNIKIYGYKTTLQSLVKKGCLRSYDSRRSHIEYEVTGEFLGAVIDNRMFEKRNISNLDLTELLQEFTGLSDERHDNYLAYDSFIYDVWELVNNNKHLPLCEFLKKQKNEFKGTAMAEMVVIYLLRACYLIGVLGKSSISISECDSLIESMLVKKSFSKFFKESKGYFIQQHIFEPAVTPDSPLADMRHFSLTEEFRKKYLRGLSISNRQAMAEMSDGTILCSNINEKKLFYHADDASQMDELTRLLKQRNFKRIQKQLKEKGYRTGFACLFYGAPGTGKTESAMQLARMTGRDIIPVDLSQIRDKYVGESEKRTKAIFDDYRWQLKCSKVAPILLLNEADGLLTKRMNVQRSTDQMENTMQNIILQEMENFEGILIATTNLSCNLDDAFERRFIYKVEFHRPDLKARKSIWQSMISDLTDEGAMSLANEFEFSGGEIENIARKYVVNNILHNHKTNVKTLLNICRNEKISTKETRKRIGF